MYMCIIIIMHTWNRLCILYDKIWYQFEGYAVCLASNNDTCHEELSRSHKGTEHP